MINNSTEQENQVKPTSPTTRYKYIAFCDMDKTHDLLTELSRRDCVYYFKSKNSENKSFLLELLPAKGYTAEVVEDGIIAVRNDLIAFGCSSKEILNVTSWPNETTDAVRTNQLLESEISKKEKLLSPITREDEIEIISDFF